MADNSSETEDATPQKPAKESPVTDIARFTDGDQLRGRFGGIAEDGSISWQREDFTQPTAFQTTKLRQIVLRGGKAARGTSHTAHARLVNGDCIPGTLVELNDASLVLDTGFAGRVTVPRDQLAAIAPNPFGGVVSYCGPFNEEGWKTIGQEEPGPNRAKAPDQAEAADDKPPKDQPQEKAKPPWAFAGTAWYCNASGPALVRDSGLGDVALLRFTAAWRTRLQLAVAFHADFKGPEPKKQENADDKDPKAKVKRIINAGYGMQAYPALFGSCYVITINSGYTMLHRCSFDDEGKPVIDRVQSGNMNVRVPESGESTFELRCDRKNASIFLYVDGEFASQWDESAEGYCGKGAGFGFQTQGPGARIRISDILAAEWNGMPDSARSMETADRDVVLLANGTDRFSGTVSAIRDEQVGIDGPFAKMNVPVSKVAEIRFAKSRRAAAQEQTGDELVIHFPPVGRLSGKAAATRDGVLRLDSPSLGKLDVNLDYAAILDFQPGNSFLDDWDSDF